MDKSQTNAFESKAAELRANQAARRGETASQGDAEKDDKGDEVSVMLFCLCVVPCKTIDMCLYVSMNLSMSLSICVPNACLSACLCMYVCGYACNVYVLFVCNM